MKKIILSITIFVFLLFVSSSSVNAEPEIDCWQTYMNHEYSICSDQFTKCLLACPSNTGLQSCSSGCSGNEKTCTNKVVASYYACVESQKKPTKVPAPTSSQSSDYVVKCWNAFSDEMGVCLTTSSKCIDACHPVTNSCLNSCSNMQGVCDKKASANHDTCIAAGRQAAQKQPETKQLEPTKAPAPTSSKSSTDCWKKYGDQTSACGDALGKCYTVCSSGVRDSCTDACKSVNDACLEKASVTYGACNDASRQAGQKQPETKKPTSSEAPTPEKPQVGVSSRDFAALARANVEFQEAQAVLEKIKSSNDPRYEAKKDFANQLQDKLQKYPEEQQDTLQIIRDRLEEVKSDAELYQKAKDFADWVKGSDLDTDSGGIGVIITVGNGLNDFIDLKNDGVSTDDAVAKVLIDSIAVDINPFVKTADIIATLPDEIMAAIGIPPNNWSRKPTVYLHDNSPSAFVELTTSAMIQSHSWENVGGAIQVAWENVKSANGLGEKAQAVLDLVGTAVGAVPVAIAMQARDTISTIFDVAKAGGVTNFLINQFWSPD